MPEFTHDAYWLRAWPELAERRRAQSTLLLPVGTIEQQGDRCPVGTDLILASRFAEDVGRAVDGLVLPPLAYGCSRAFAGFPGTIWIQGETLRRLVSEIGGSVLAGGFRYLAIVNNHGPNEPFLEEAVRDLQDAHGVRIPVLWPARAAQVLGHDLFAGGRGRYGHGAEPTTSLLLHLLGQRSSLEGGAVGRLSPVGGFQPTSTSQALVGDVPIGWYSHATSLSATGSMGDPTGASAARGAELWARVVRWGIDTITAWRGLP